MNWDLVTNIILGASLLALAVFAGLGLYQWITRRSFQKIDLKLRTVLIPLILMVVIYFIFDHIFVLNTRPDGSGEPSFPSTHVMVVATIFGTLILLLPKYVASKPLRLVLSGVMILLTILVAVGRVLANKHWPSDVVGGLIFAGILVTIYYLFSREPGKKTNETSTLDDTMPENDANEDSWGSFQDESGDGRLKDSVEDSLEDNADSSRKE